MSQEKRVWSPNGWAVLPVTIGIFAGAIYLTYRFVLWCVAMEQANSLPNFWLPLAAFLAVFVVWVVAVFSCYGYFTLQPNEGRVLISILLFPLKRTK